MVNALECLITDYYQRHNLVLPQCEKKGQPNARAKK